MNIQTKRDYAPFTSEKIRCHMRLSLFDKVLSYSNDVAQRTASWAPSNTDNEVEVEETFKEETKKWDELAPIIGELGYNHMAYLLKKLKVLLKEGKVEFLQYHTDFVRNYEKQGINDFLALVKNLLDDGTYYVEYLRFYGPDLDQPVVKYLIEKIGCKALQIQYIWTGGDITITEKMMNCSYLNFRGAITNPELLKEFQGDVLIIREPEKSGLSYGFILDLVERWWSNGERPIKEYIAMVGGDMTEYVHHFDKYQGQEVNLSKDKAILELIEKMNSPLQPEFTMERIIKIDNRIELTRSNGEKARIQLSFVLNIMAFYFEPFTEDVELQIHRRPQYFFEGFA